MLDNLRQHRSNSKLKQIPKLIAFLKRTGDGYQRKKRSAFDLASAVVITIIIRYLFKNEEYVVLFVEVPKFQREIVHYTVRERNALFWAAVHFEARGNNAPSTKYLAVPLMSDIDRFLSSADDKEFLMIKVGLILGIAGACRTDELVNLTVDGIEGVGSSLIVKIPNTKKRFHESLWLPMWEICLNCFENTCPFVLPTSSITAFFCTTKQENPVGKNTMGKIPSVVASYLKLPDVACYTGHCLRRSSATLLADAGVDITTIKRHAGWKSTTVAEGYVENSIENKTKIANQVLVGTTTSVITKTVNVSESNISSNINFENCTNVTFNLNVNK
ncbi:hypothetical protein NQ317_006114 [Molorchus minor]|uniref:Tyr recombinase domain-containing protein n=1 Tax=Molorchus minor TaxID=1323400 RepID=A0ABQ9JKP6_9CUCU|nr:hypothetical protein NQ317_006114 [Molorchus minor]